MYLMLIIIGQSTAFKTEPWLTPNSNLSLFLHKSCFQVQAILMFLKVRKSKENGSFLAILLREKNRRPPNPCLPVGKQVLGNVRCRQALSATIAGGINQVALQSSVTSKSPPNQSAKRLTFKVFFATCHAFITIKF